MIGEEGQGRSPRHGEVMGEGGGAPSSGNTAVGRGFGGSPMEGAGDSPWVRKVFDRCDDFCDSFCVQDRIIRS